MPRKREYLTRFDFGYSEMPEKNFCPYFQEEVTGKNPETFTPNIEKIPEYAELFFSLLNKAFSGKVIINHHRY